MRKALLASAAMMSALLFAAIAATTPVPNEATQTGYGVYAVRAAQR
ncbi:MAG: hypothetical protein K0R27_3453 [Xanthobacteraceae bacterium]|jgi:hypothetical protein|nr:hypothetical protein [Xanthobacteraceae bacterium]